MRGKSPQSPEELAFAHSPGPSEESSTSAESTCSKACKNGGGRSKISKSKKANQSILFPTTSSMPPYYQYLLLHSLQMDDDVEFVLPKDPRRWTKDDVNLWLMELSIENNINPPLEPTKFPFNGKALCSLNVDMFLSRVPDFGKLLFKDVQLRLAKSVIKKKLATSDAS